MRENREFSSGLHAGALPPVVFFDIGDTLGSPVLVASPPRLERLDVFPYVPGVLEQLRDAGVRLGIISNTGDETRERVDQVLAEAGIGHFFDSALLLYSSEVGLTKDSPEIFRLAVEHAGHGDAPERCVFVGEDTRERSYAQSAGLRVAPHPRLAAAVLESTPLHYVRVGIPPGERGQDWRSAVQGLDLVPLHVSGEEGSRVLAVASDRAALALDDLGFQVDRLGAPGSPLETDLYLLRDDRARTTGFLAPEGQSRLLPTRGGVSPTLSSIPEGLVVAVPADRSVEDYHLPEAYHGHNLKLLPDPALLNDFAASAFDAGALDAAKLPPPDGEEMAAFRTITADEIRRHVIRYAGPAPLGDGGGEGDGPIASRHVDSADNARVVAALARDLEMIGGGGSFSVRLHRFGHEGRVLHNVEAELPGSDSDELVLVTAHLDSTAASNSSYDPVRDPAPGADDDASGIAGVLTIAAALRTLARSRPPRRTLRFVLFNAEEHGLVGSKAYARALAAVGTRVLAVFQLDMIGYNVSEPRAFEVHTGYGPAPAVQARSHALARALETLTPLVSPELTEPQVYLSGPGGSDPAEGRSDHASFHERGWAACAISEDFFVGPGSAAPVAEPNPNYHRREDTFVDFAYAADVARVVAAAAWAAARA